jgi:hypothetical protein
VRVVVIYRCARTKSLAAGEGVAASRSNTRVDSGEAMTSGSAKQLSHASIVRPNDSATVASNFRTSDLVIGARYRHAIVRGAVRIACHARSEACGPPGAGAGAQRCWLLRCISRVKRRVVGVTVRDELVRLRDVIALLPEVTKRWSHGARPRIIR